MGAERRITYQDMCGQRRYGIAVSYGADNAGPYALVHPVDETTGRWLRAVRVAMDAILENPTVLPIEGRLDTV